MLTIRDLWFRLGAEELFCGVSCEVFRGQRIGLVGRNGSGKSTLLKLINRGAEPDAGSVDFSGQVRVVSVSQEIPDTESSVLSFTLDGDEELRALEARLAREPHDDGYFAAQAHYEAIQGFAAPARASQLLAGLGFAESDLARPVKVLSGGWRMRLNLARALMGRADLLLLDEPTNHLDLEAIAWLEQYLARFEGALLVVSHDRDFLNTVVNRIAAIHDHVLTLYTGSYDAFVSRRGAEVVQQQASYERQQARIADLERFVTRFRAKATKARQAQSRLKMLERMERVAKVQGDVLYDLPLPSPERAPDTLISLRDVTFAYPGRAPVFAGVRLSIAPGDRIAVIGPNGAGKSTFLKILVGQLDPLAGTRILGPGVTLGYFAQHQLEQLDPNMRPLEYLAALDKSATPQALRDYLGRFGFGASVRDRPVRDFSGGEKSRLVLAGLSWLKPHVLLLDEPTNHLDLEMREALMYALQDYAGALVLVSHDRHLIRSCADALWLVADGQAREFTGDLDDYQREMAARRMPPVAAKPKTDRRIPAVSPKTYLKEQKAIEARLAGYEARLAEIDGVLGDALAYRQGGDMLKALQAERRTMSDAHAQDEERWLALEEKVHALQSGLV
ncbi:MAG TPA: ABC-F family ATP-binding cassette domain-containing protein [Acidiferrobacter sp.]|nr:ABC-F family ATP-binding cassette domain-containing protein [Acidiferrobacter sp.]